MLSLIEKAYRAFPRGYLISLDAKRKGARAGNPP
jgi:hypothetical protein